jgi:WD40 repeat protein
VAFSPDGKYLASGSDDKKVKLWSIESHKNVTVFHGHTNFINCLNFSPDGKYLASTSHDKTIKIWSVYS